LKNSVDRGTHAAAVPMKGYDMKPVTLHIEGMSCGHCLNAVNRALSALPGVRLDSVEIGRAALHYDESVIDPAAIEHAVSDAGYRATMQ
jgi:copper chaperone CopZ